MSNSSKKLERIIKAQTEGPSLKGTVASAAILGALVGAAKVLGSIFGKE